MAHKGSFLEGTGHPVEQHINGMLGEKNMAPRSLGIGSGQHQASVGAHNAVWAHVDLSNVTDLANVPVPHSLGEIPVHCEYVDHENSRTPATFIQVRPANRSNWTATECRVAVSITVGAAAGTVVRFKVWGA